MLPVIVIVGRPNVGKSTLFNRLTETRDALVANWPGVTRDRQYGRGRVGERPYIVVDTGGLSEPDDEEMAALTDQQVKLAMQEADLLLFMVDAKEGLTSPDRQIANHLREQCQDKVVVLVNKADRDDANMVMAEFYELGFNELHPVSASMGRGVTTLMTSILSQFPSMTEETDLDSDRPKVAVIGRPNVGKSTLVNRILGEERMVVLDRPGTTRDSIAVEFEHREKQYQLIDTAGVRRRARIDDAVEKFSVIKTLQAIELAHIVIVVLDARDIVTDQDLHLLGKVLQFGKGLILAFNKWDGMDDYDRERFKEAADRKLEFVDFARRYFISALHGTGVGKLYQAIDEAYEVVRIKLSTPELTQALEQAQKSHQPPLVGGRRIKLRYAHLGGHDPLVIVIHGKQIEKLPGSYQRYLVNFFRKRFKIIAIPIHLRFINDHNPYNK